MFKLRIVVDNPAGQPETWDKEASIENRQDGLIRIKLLGATDYLFEMALGEEGRRVWISQEPHSSDAEYAIVRQDGPVFLARLTRSEPNHTR